jgi:hypothetical protein
MESKARREELERKIAELPGHLQMLAHEYLHSPKLSNLDGPKKLMGVRQLLVILQEIREFHQERAGLQGVAEPKTAQERLSAEINRGSPELKAYFHEMETWEHSSQAFEILNMREEIRALKWKLEKEKRR